MNKKIFSITIALLLTASMLMTACGGTPATAPGATAPGATAPAATVPAPTSAPVTLTIWHNWGPDDAKGAPLQTIFADFMAANPDILIADEVYVDADIPLKVETASAANQEPDLVFTGGFGNALSWTDSGVTIPVNDLITQWGLDGQFKDAALSNYTLPDGQIIAFPLEGFTWPVWYNTAIFAAVGLEIPTTTDQLIAAAQTLRAAGYGGPVIASGIDSMGGKFFELIIQSAMTDAEAIQCMGQGDWTAPGCIKGVELFVQLRDAGVFVDGVEGVDYPSGNTRFFAGDKVAVSHFGAWAFGEAPPELLPDIQLGGFPLPAGSPHQLPVYFSAFTAKGVFITPNGASKMDAVEKFITFLYQPAMIARFVEQAGMTPPLKEVPVDATELNSLFAQSLVLPAEVVAISDTYKPAQVVTDFDRVTMEAFAPGTTAEQILAGMTAAYAALK